MEWTTDKPTKPGLYWAHDDIDGVVPVDIYLLDDKLILVELGRDYGLLSHENDYDYFMGPIPQPEPPTISADQAQNANV